MVMDSRNAQIWHTVLHDGIPVMRRKRFVFRHLPSNPRCSLCFSPFSGFGGSLVRRLLHIERSNYNPTLCNTCEDLVRNYPGGAEVEMSMMFADVRGSTTLAEGMTPSEFSRLMDRYYTIATAAVEHTGGLIEKFVGDNATVLFPPGISGHDHARRAIDTARHILEHTGHGHAEGPWLPVGAGVHTGNAFVGSIGSGGVSQLTALGDAVNAAARLAGKAAAGEILISQETCEAAGLDTSGLERRELALKGKAAPMTVYVMRVGAA